MSALQQILDTIKKSGSNELTDLHLTGIKINKLTNEMKKAMEQCSKLQLLVMDECELTSLENLPDLDITAIDLSKNKISDNQVAHLKKYPGLVQVLLSNNDINTLQCLDALKECKRLQDLNLQGNPVNKLQGYRKSIFQKLTALDSLDDLDQEGNIIQREDDFDQDQDEADEEFDEDDDDDEESYEEDQYNSEEEVDDQPKKKKKK